VHSTVENSIKIL